MPIYNHNIHLTKEQVKLYHAIQSLQILIENNILSSSEMAQYEIMLTKKKKKLVFEIHFKDKKRKEFYACKDGRIKSYDPQFIAPSEDTLIEKLFNFYFNNTLESVYKKWVQQRSETKIVSGKTIEEDMGVWRRHLADSEIALMQIAEIRPKHLLKLFQKWTGKGLITRKDFNNRKSLLNNIFRHAVLEEIIPYNPITSIPLNTLNFKLPSAKKKAYTLEERKRLLLYLKTLEQDAYVLAIILAFYGIFRIGEIKGLSWDIDDGNEVRIEHQLVEERMLQDDMTLSSPCRVLKDPKGNPNYSIRTEIISDEGVSILKKMKGLNPNGRFLFMHEGRPLTTDSFNRRLKKYCAAVGISYLSSHKIRFTGASMLYDAGVKAIDIQPLLGHSTLSMTEHYIGQRVNKMDSSQMAKVLA
ncbi:tyrosine-type recombinase/integrase [Faecalicatena contorta]|uniref:Site-specific recombinase XerD n=1 Tax=Faecalicatena contorta TaxID=39482 RepID=A0A316A7U7_9FIRM|nr:tyrosine-type recombinase/integrase [Faecalicatena contorta]PWJ45817.1 site-specific recombinase XerD [Faecalicatena contorta]SUQ16423.1 Site-specific recombinase XerD [Faecalicatena contorta]